MKKRFENRLNWRRWMAVAVTVVLVAWWMAVGTGCGGWVEQPSASNADREVAKPSTAPEAARPAEAPATNTIAKELPAVTVTAPKGGSAVDHSPGAALFDRVAVIGASATCGFGVQTEIEGPYGPTTAPMDLATAVQAVFEVNGPVSKQCSFFFFSDPMKVGPMLMDAALAGNPTIVFALDYLFWFGYGGRDVQGKSLAGNEAGRLELLEAGLKQLERCKCPVVVGDYPDMHEAIGLMLGAGQVPSVETLKLLNARLREWASGRENVIIVPTSEFVAAMLTEGSFEVGGVVWNGRQTRKHIIQADRLHPTAEGLVLMAEHAAEAMAASDIGLTKEMYEDDHSAAMERLKAVLRK